MDQEASEAKWELFNRLDERLAWNIVMLGHRTSAPNVDDIYALGDLIDLHHYLTETHVFAPGEAEALLCFQDPLVVAQNCRSENRYKDGYPICKILEDIDAYKQFPLTKAEEERRNEPLVQQLKERLDKNFAAYTAALMDKSKQELLAESESIAATRAAYEYMRNDFDYSYGTTNLLLKLDDPLKYLAAHWSLSFDLSGDDDDIIEEIITDLEDPSGIPTEDFVRDGRRYYLLDMIKEDEVGVDTQDYTDTVTQDSDTNDLSLILKQLDPHREVTTEDGYTGLLALDYTSVTVEAKGYKTSTRSLSATRTYPNLSDADLSLVPKTITDSGKTLTLGAVEWSVGESGYYTATATYSGTASSRYATGYTVTACYTGQVSKTGCDIVKYTAIFGSEELPAEDTLSELPSQPDETEQTAPEVPVADPAEASGVNWLSLLGCAGGVAAFAAAGLWASQKWKGRRKST